MGAYPGKAITRKVKPVYTSSCEYNKRAEVIGFEKLGRVGVRARARLQAKQDAAAAKDSSHVK